MTRRLPAPARDVVALWDASPSLRREYVIAELLAFSLGATLILGGEARMRSSASFDTMLVLGGPWPWGLLLIAGGVMLLVASRAGAWACHWALRVGAGVYALIATSFAVSAWPPSSAPWWGSLLFAIAMSLGHLSDAADYRPTRPPEVRT